MTSLADYQWLFRKAPAMATSIGEDGAYVDVNDAFLKRLGYERADMVGRKPAEFVTAESAKRIETELMPILRRTFEANDVEQLSSTFPASLDGPSHETRDHREVFLHRHVGEQPDSLKNVADLAAQYCRVLGRDVFSIDEDPSRGGLDESVLHLEQRRLAATGRTKKNKRFPFAHVE